MSLISTSRWAMFYQIRCFASASHEQTSLVHVEKQFEAVIPEKRDKDAFMAAIAMFKEKRGRTHVEFINTALKYVKEYGVHKDLDTYKNLLDVFPKGKMIPQTAFQKIFLHYPQQQNCAVKVLDEMEWHGVQPDKEIHDIMVNAFGEWNFATKKVKRMLYWMPKLKHSNKYLDRRHVEGKSLSPSELAGIALKMMSRDPASSISLLKFSDSSDPVSKWLATSQSPSQQRLISELQKGEEIFVDAGRVYVQDHPVAYITLTGTPKSAPTDEFKKEEMDEDYTSWFQEWKKGRVEAKRSMHEQSHETVYALGAMYQNDNSTALRWVDNLQKTNSNLANLRIRVRLDGKLII
uniref:Evolutionarily conserved signaling intermediate in Toll pathway, mitochondrial n=1 Tax=Caenorhabditis japonica TaxID=281687 RepID=A0A8R1E1C3_CAEJA